MLEAALQYDMATATHQGARAYQEDSLLTQSAGLDTLGVAVIADGMGGHAAGDVASGIVCTEVFRQISAQNTAVLTGNADIPAILTTAAQTANTQVDSHVKSHAETYGMGSTLLATIIADNALSWASIGDSPLYLYRGGTLQRLNADHSMAPQVDMLVKIGALSEQEGRDHPSRHALTSVIRGRKIEEIDCPKTPTSLGDGDIIIVSSDGLQYLSDLQIHNVLKQTSQESAQTIVDALLADLEKLDDPEQDNIAYAVIKCVQN
jgi:serine/threonine protein phosphatase PrpC